MIKCVKIKAELGKSSNKSINNLFKSMNNIIREAINYNVINVRRFFRSNETKSFAATERRAIS